MDKFVIWGNGGLTKLVLKGLDQRPELIVDGLLQSGKKTTNNGINVYSADEFFKHDFGNITVIICSMYFFQIIPLLEKNGFQHSQIKIAFKNFDDNFEIIDIAGLSHTVQEYQVGHERYSEIMGDIDKIEGIKIFDSKKSVREMGVNLKSIDGLNLEFGVYRGESINQFCSWSDEPIYGFDSFEGLPEFWLSGLDKGAFDVGGALPNVPENATLIKGWFDKTLPKFLLNKDGDISFLHLDADIYSSTIYVLNSLKDRIKKGTIIVLDEYCSIYDPTHAEYVAFHEYIDNENVQFEYLCRSYDSVAVRIC